MWSSDVYIVGIGSISASSFFRCLISDDAVFTFGLADVLLELEVFLIILFPLVVIVNRAYVVQTSQD